MYNNSLIDLNSSIKALKLGQVELSRRINDNLADFKTWPNSQEKPSPLSPKDKQSVETCTPAMSLMAPVREEVHDIGTIVDLSQPLVNQSNHTKFCSPSQTKQMELANSYGTQLKHSINGYSPKDENTG